MNNYEKQVQTIMAQSIEERALYIESIDPTGKVIAIEEINHRKNVFNQILQEVKEGNEVGYTFNDIVDAYQDFTNEYNRAILNLK
jgi:hypothetical protein